MAKPELGTKRVCPVTGRKFYDLNKDPVISPYTGEVVPIAPVPASRGRVEPAAARAAPVVKDEETVDRDEEFVSLEDADAESKTSGKKVAAVDDDIDIDDDDDTSDDDTLIEDSEEESDDVSDIIGDGREDEEET